MKRRRKSIRLKEYDYTQPGAYFVTICTYRRAHLFGQVVDGEMRLNAFGKIVWEEWFRTAQVRPYVELFENEFVVMPNHIHGIIWIVEHDVGATRRVAPTSRRVAPQPPRGPVPQSLGAIIAQFKSVVTKRINTLRGTPGAPVWQRNYWEHVIRTERALNAIRRYIIENPARWHLDRYNPAATGTDPLARESWHLMRQAFPSSRLLGRIRERDRQPSRKHHPHTTGGATMTQEHKPLVPIIMGSQADLPHAQRIAEALAALGIESELRVASAHKHPQYLLEMLAAYEADPRPKVYITVAGRSNALSGLVDAQVRAPVIACPPLSGTFGPWDLFSSVRMPSGVAPALVLEPENAALLAAKILGLYDAVAKKQQEYRQAIETADANLQSPISNL